MLTVSVIVPTYNGANKIPVILNALKGQDCQVGEIIVVVDGSTDNSLEVLENIKDSLPQLKVIFQSNKGRAAVRNAGAHSAKGELLVFLDDDMKPETHCLSVHVAHHQKSMNSILTGAQVDSEQSLKDFQKFKATVNKRWVNNLTKASELPQPKSSAFITAANFSISRKLFFELGGFDERLLDGEDFDLAFRAGLRGIPIFYNHNAFAWHLEDTTCAHFIKRNRSYYQAGLYLAQVNPELYESVFGHRRVTPKTLKARFFKIFCHSFWIKSIDRNNWTWLPRFFRYKLYDYVATANSFMFPDIVKL